jgi:NADH-quinone oxidoreductase subunit L
LPARESSHEAGGLVLQLTAAVVAIGGVYLAYLLFVRRAGTSGEFAGDETVQIAARFARSGWGFDLIYAKTLVQPYLWLARVNRGDFVEAVYDAIAAVTRLGHRLLAFTQSGGVRLYARTLVAGVIVAVGVAAFW